MANNGLKHQVKLAAEIGTEMQVEITNLGNRIKLTMVGIVPGEYLLFQLPEKFTTKAAKSTAFSADTIINVRSLSRGTAFGFNSTILGTSTTPDTLLFVKYPYKIQQQTIRKNQRVKCLLPATLTKNTMTINGTIADLSASGCHFQTQKSKLSAEEIKIIKSEESINIAISLPAIEGEKSISALIKNTFVDADKIQLGIEFEEIDQATMTMIENFINMSFDISPF